MLDWVDAENAETPAYYVTLEATGETLVTLPHNADGFRECQRIVDTVNEAIAATAATFAFLASKE